jgi:hypothetical protein
MIDQSKVKLYFIRALQPSSDTLPLRCSTFLLLSPLVTICFRNDLVTDCFFRDKCKNRVIAQKQWIFLFIHIYFLIAYFLSLGAAT